MGAEHPFEEREIRSVTANTRIDGEEFMQIAGEIPLRTDTQFFGLEQATEALLELKQDVSAAPPCCGWRDHAARCASFHSPYGSWNLDTGAWAANHSL